MCYWVARRYRQDPECGHTLVFRYGPCEEGNPETCFRSPRWEWAMVKNVKGKCHHCRARLRYQADKALEELEGLGDALDDEDDEMGVKKDEVDGEKRAADTATGKI